MKLLLSGTIFFYQEILSSQDGNNCPYRPSCSHYAAEAVKKHQLLGIAMAGDRLVRCNPYAHNMYHEIEGSFYYYDPVELDSLKNKTLIDKY